MTQELIPLSTSSIGGQQIQTVNARELHAFLGCKTPFSRWIRNRIDDYGFVENKDYARIELPAGMKMAESGGGLGGITNAQKSHALESMGYESFGQQGRIEYAISLDMAKELSMVERNEKGKQARQYFIRCEKLLKTTVSLVKTVEENKVGAYFAIARHMVAMVNVSPERATAAALAAIREDTGLATEAYRATLPAVEPKNLADLNATAVGKEVGLRASEVNLKLAEFGLIEKDPSGKGWKLTAKGTEYGEARPYYNNGHSGCDIKWRKSVVELLRRTMEK